MQKQAVLGEDEKALVEAIDASMQRTSWPEARTAAQEDSPFRVEL